MARRKAAQMFSVWEHVCEELEARNLPIASLWHKAGLTMQEYADLNGTKNPVLSRRTCEKLARFFGTSVGLWLRLAGHKEGSKR
jgi:plasmid maintenance system antidote protein VapI